MTCTALLHRSELASHFTAICTGSSQGKCYCLLQRWHSTRTHTYTHGAKWPSHFQCKNDSSLGGCQFPLWTCPLSLHWLPSCLRLPSTAPLPLFGLCDLKLAKQKFKGACDCLTSSVNNQMCLCFSWNGVWFRKRAEIIIDDPSGKWLSV